MASEDAPKPKITAILRDDLKKNERDYYIWHTRKDEKVRDRHKGREGKIFNWHVPPEGGHPGEDYNCRCWAEPYRAEMAEQFNITPKFDLSGLPQYAENDKANVVSDGTYGLTQTISDDELLNLMAYNLLNKEKMKNYIYLDKLGHITSGVGALLDDEEDFKSIPWMIGNRLATEDEIDAAYKMFTFKRFEKDENGKFKNHNRLAESFKKECSLRVSKEYMAQRMMTHLKEDLTRAKRKRPDFDTYPIPLKLIILDFYYNKGSFYNQPDLPQALNARDAKLFQEKMVRHMADRDEWTQKQFNLIPRNFWKNY